MTEIASNPQRPPAELAYLRGFQYLRRLSWSSPVFLCRESASGRLVTIRLFQSEESPSFHNHVQALILLEGCHFSPRLLAANSQWCDHSEWPHLLVTQHLPGTPLLQCKDELTQPQRLRLMRELSQIVASLHKNYAFAHGDLTPANVLWTRDERLAIIDWEMAQPTSQHHLQSWQSLRGTIGFGGGVADAQSRDEVAVGKIAEFLAIIPAAPKRRLWPWGRA